MNVFCKTETQTAKCKSSPNPNPDNPMLQARTAWLDLREEEMKRLKTMIEQHTNVTLETVNVAHAKVVFKTSLVPIPMSQAAFKTSLVLALNCGPYRYLPCLHHDLIKLGMGMGM